MGLHLFQAAREIAATTLTINAHMYIEISDNFLILLIEIWFGDDDVIFLDDNASCHGVNGITVEKRR